MVTIGIVERRGIGTAAVLYHCVRFEQIKLDVPYYVCSFPRSIVHLFLPPAMKYGLGTNLAALAWFGYHVACLNLGVTDAFVDSLQAGGNEDRPSILGAMSTLCYVYPSIRKRAHPSRKPTWTPERRKQRIGNAGAHDSDMSARRAPLASWPSSSNLVTHKG